jgi:hypothetical protein
VSNCWDLDRSRQFVLAMLTVTGVDDNVPILPEVWIEWREVFEYGASILLAFVSGNILGRPDLPGDAARAGAGR